MNMFRQPTAPRQATGTYTWTLELQVDGLFLAEIDCRAMVSGVIEPDGEMMDIMVDFIEVEAMNPTAPQGQRYIWKEAPAYLNQEIWRHLNAHWNDVLAAVE